MLQRVPWNFLRIDGWPVLNAYARNVRQSLTFIEEGGEIVRLASGERVSLRRSQFRKYKITISGEATRKPAIDHLHRGDVVLIDCPGHIDLPGFVLEGDFHRAAVPGSIRYIGEVNGRPALLEAGDARIVATTFRPRLYIMIDNIEIDEDVTGGSVSWSLSGEEL